MVQSTISSGSRWPSNLGNQLSIYLQTLRLTPDRLAIHYEIQSPSLANQQPWTSIFGHALFVSLHLRLTKTSLLYSLQLD